MNKIVACLVLLFFIGVQTVLAQNLEIIQHPQSQTKVVGEDVTFSVGVSGGTTPYQYKWQKDDVDIPAAPDNSDYTINGVALSNAGDYKCVVIDDGGAGTTLTSDAATLSVYAVPVVSDVPGQTINEGESFAKISLDGYVTDDDTPDDQISWIAAGQSGLTVTITAREATITYGTWTGTETVTFTAEDPEGNKDSDDATFTINAAPKVSNIPDQTIVEGQTFQTINLDDFVLDVDTPDDQITWKANTSDVTVTIDVNRVATITYGTWTGSETVTFTAEDPEGNTGSDDATFKVTAVPVVSDIPDETINEGESFVKISLDGYVTDDDTPDDQISWTATGQSSLTVTIIAREATITYGNWTGTETVTFTAEDPEGNKDTDDATFTINAAPKVSDIPDQTIVEGQMFQTINLDDFVLDVDTPDDQITWKTNASDVTVTIDANRVATITYGTWTGSDAVTFTAEDPEGNTGSDDVTFKVTAVPVVSDIPGETINEGESFAMISLDGYVTDEDSPDDQITWTTNASDLTITIDGNREATITYGTWTGTETVTFTAEDPEGNKDSDDATFTVRAAPVVSNISNRSVVTPQGFANINLNKFVSDADTPDDQITWTTTGGSNITVNVTDPTATKITYASGWTGAETVTFAATDPEGNTDSDDATFRVHPPIIINPQPTSVAKYTGQNATFTIGASGGNGSFTYRWQRKLQGAWVNTSATGTTFTRNNLNLGHAGDYRCMVTSLGWSVPSNVATLTVYQTVRVTQHPSNVTVWPNESVSFSITAEGHAPINYQWQKDNANLQGAPNNPTLTIGSVTPFDEGVYRCIATNGGGSDISGSATLTVNGPAIVTQHPANDTVYTGRRITITMSASGTAPLSYQWQKNNVDIQGATGRRYIKDDAVLADVGYYRCVVSNGGGKDTSAAAKLSVFQTVYITGQPSPVVVNVGESATFSVTAAGHEPIIYRWQKNNITISGATSATYTIPSVAMSDAGFYRCRVSNGGGSVNSNIALLSVNGPATIIQHPKDSIGWTGNEITFGVLATGTAPLAYQWQKNSVNITNQTSPLLTLDSLTMSDSGYFRCIVSNIAGVDTSNTARLVMKETVAITDHPDSQTVYEGDSASFSIGASGSDTITYRWQKNGFNINGATASTYTIQKVTSAHAGNYTCIARNGGGRDTSVAARLEVKGAGLTVVSPNGGETWQIQTTQEITWTTLGNLDSVKIEFSTTGGSSWEIITGSAPNTSTYSWELPIALTEFCKVRVSDAEDDFPADESDSLFTISKIVAILGDDNDDAPVTLGELFVTPNPACKTIDRQVEFIVTPKQDIAQAVVKVFDPFGNLMAEIISEEGKRFPAGRQCSLGTWPLTNRSKRFVAGGAYVAVVIFTAPDGTKDMQKTLIGIKNSR